MAMPVSSSTGTVRRAKALLVNGAEPSAAWSQDSKRNSSLPFITLQSTGSCYVSGTGGAMEVLEEDGQKKK
jgi:hypothetical protein